MVDTFAITRIRHSGRVRLVTHLLILASTLGCAPKPSEVSIAPQPSGGEVLTENIGGFQFKYVNNEHGDRIRSRAARCREKLDTRVNRQFTSDIRLTELPAGSDRLMALVIARTSSEDIDVLTAEISQSVGDWRGYSRNQINDIVFRGGDVEPMRGGLDADSVSALSIPISAIELLPRQSHSPITHQACYFLMILDKEGSSSIVMLSDTLPPTDRDAGKRNYGDITDHLLAASAD